MFSLNSSCNNPTSDKIPYSARKPCPVFTIHSKLPDNRSVCRCHVNSCRPSLSRKSSQYLQSSLVLVQDWCYQGCRNVNEMKSINIVILWKIHVHFDQNFMMQIFHKLTSSNTSVFIWRFDSFGDGTPEPNTTTRTKRSNIHWPLGRWWQLILWNNLLFY